LSVSALAQTKHRDEPVIDQFPAVADLGLGKDIWKVSFENIEAILKIYYFDEDLYLTALPLVKISILLFYLRIFPQKWFRYACFATMAACVGYGIAFLLVSVFQCRPIDLAWNHWDGEHEGVCNNINAQGWTSAALNVVLDVVVLGLPMPVIAKLELNKRKKALVLLMFSTGFVVTIISILRLQVLVNFGTENFTCMLACTSDRLGSILLIIRRALPLCRLLEHFGNRSRGHLRLHARHACSDQMVDATSDGRDDSWKISWSICQLQLRYRQERRTVV
jgi:hypothetical protein